MKGTLIVLFVLILAGCGVDGEPTRPTMNTNVGVSSDGDVHAHTSVGVVLGQVGVSVGF